VARALDVYFQRFHRQPVWCFNQEDVKSHEMIADELLSAIMALSCHFLPHAEWLQHYTSTTRSLIMLHIANGTVRVATLESLCLLSLSLLHGMLIFPLYCKRD
jgi:hypothetical protein